MHTINTFLFGEPNSVSRQDVFTLVKNYFSDWEDVEFGERTRPLGLPPTFMATIDGYVITVDYIDSAGIHESIAYVENVTNLKLPSEQLLGEIRTIFSDDPESDFDHVTVSMYQFLEELPRAVVFDDSQKKIVSSTL